MLQAFTRNYRDNSTEAQAAALSQALAAQGVAEDWHDKMDTREMAIIIAKRMVEKLK